MSSILDPLPLCPLSPSIWKPSWQSLAEGVTQPAAGWAEFRRGGVELRFRRAALGPCGVPPRRPRASPTSLLAGTCAPNQEAPGGGRGMAGPGWGLPRLDGFILTERLGSGTYATVYKAYAKVGVGAPCPRCPGAGHPAPVPTSPEQVRLGDGPAGAGARRPPDARRVEEAGAGRPS